MRAVPRQAFIRIDADAVEVRGRRSTRVRSERHPVLEGEDPLDVLEDVLQTSPLLGPGRRCELGILLESPRILYRTHDGAGDDPGAGPEMQAVMPELMLEALEPILARRRMHGDAWFMPGPVERAFRTIRRQVDADSGGRGLIVDRSSAAVTVLLVDGGLVRWARGAPAEDPTETAAILIRRAIGPVDPQFGLDWWHLEDVASPGDERDRLLGAQAFEASCDTLVGHLPRVSVAP